MPMLMSISNGLVMGKNVAYFSNHSLCPRYEPTFILRHVYGSINERFVIIFIALLLFFPSIILSWVTILRASNYSLRFCFYAHKKFDFLHGKKMAISWNKQSKETIPKYIICKYLNYKLLFDLRF